MMSATQVQVITQKLCVCTCVHVCVCVCVKGEQECDKISKLWVNLCEEYVDIDN